jgi:hypothetical protein
MHSFGSRNVENEFPQEVGRMRTAAHAVAIIGAGVFAIPSNAWRHVALGSRTANVGGVVVISTVAANAFCHA